MTIDFSKGLDYWIGIIKELLSEVAKFVEDVFGIKIFAPAGDEEETTGA